jgi:hypothetical protein
MKRFSLFVACIVLVIFHSFAVAEDPLTQNRRACVKGLTKISIIVNHYKGEEEQARRFKTEVELRLRQAGIGVGPGSAFIMLGRSPHDGVCDIQAEIQEYGKFERRHGFSELAATTWESSRHRTKQRIEGHDWDAARKVLMVAVDEFLNDYLAANPREAK